LCGVSHEMLFKFIHTPSHIIHGLHVAVDWLTLLLCIQEIQLSNLSPETDFPDWSSSWVCSVTPGKCWGIIILQ